VFGTLVLVFLIYVAFEIVLSLIFAVLPGSARGFIASIVSGTLVAPFIAIVVSLIWYRLTAAHQNQSPPPGYGAPGGYGEPAYPPPYGSQPPQYGDQPPYGNQPPQYGDQPPQYGNVPPASYGSPGPTGETGPAGETRTNEPWGDSTRADTPPNGTYTHPDNPPS
jgi:hypothetical protein